MNLDNLHPHFHVPVPGKAIVASVTEHFHEHFNIKTFELFDVPMPGKAIVTLVAEHRLKLKVSALLLPDHHHILNIKMTMMVIIMMTIITFGTF